MITTKRNRRAADLLRRWGIGVLVVVAWGVFSTVPASAEDAEHISSYDVALTVGAGGSMGVTETIAYDFGTNRRHGIFRTIPTKVPFDNDNFRLYPLSDVRVTSPDGAPTDVSRSEAAGVTTLRIGDPDKTITGRHTYVLRYTVDGALNSFPDRVELYWNAIGTEWSVPIDAATVRVVAPAALMGQVCFAGVAGSVQPCTSATVTGTKHAVEFTLAGGLSPYNAFTVAVALPTDAVAAASPILERRWTLALALTPTALTGALAAAILLLGLGLVLYLVGTLGRDRRYVGQTPGLLPVAGTTADEEAVPMISWEPVAVAFRPPEGLRPGQIGTLIDERANIVDVTATIVDLAVRGYLRIDELERAHWFSSRDWILVKLRDDDGLLPYEAELFTGLFEVGDTVFLSTLKKNFSARLARVQRKLYQDVTAAGWSRGCPDLLRSRWKTAGFVLTIVAAFLAFKLFKLLHWGPVAIALLIVGLAVLYAGRRMPARTARGTAVLTQARGFREYIHTAEADQLRFEEGVDIFGRYLPYAIVFGEADRWVRVFGPLAAGEAVSVGHSAAPLWYSGPNGWDSSHFSDSLSGFTSSVSSTIAASASGGSGFSGGFSGGGGGGGGGGSW
jgi:uncharacterized membrane protein YgcG